MSNEKYELTKTIKSALKNLADGLLENFKELEKQNSNFEARNKIIKKWSRSIKYWETKLEKINKEEKQNWINVKDYIVLGIHSSHHDGKKHYQKFFN